MRGRKEGRGEGWKDGRKKEGRKDGGRRGKRSPVGSKADSRDSSEGDHAAAADMDTADTSTQSTRVHSHACMHTFCWQQALPRPSHPVPLELSVHLGTPSLPWELRALTCFRPDSPWVQDVSVYPSL